MAEDIPDLCVMMINEDLASAPVFDLPATFGLRWYEPGDVETWLAIHHAAETHIVINRELFFDQFAHDTLLLGERLCFLLEAASGRAIATATAWAETQGRFAGYGRVHWVAVVPAFQGRGVGTLVVSAACRRLLLLGHRRAFLRTSTLRPAAIRLYEKFGFVIEGTRPWKPQNT